MNHIGVYFEFRELKPECTFTFVFLSFIGSVKVASLVAQKVNVYNAGNWGSISGLGRSPEEGNGNPLQYFCMENPMNEGAWWATVNCVSKSRTQLSD